MNNQCCVVTAGPPPAGSSQTDNTAAATVPPAGPPPVDAGARAVVAVPSGIVMVRTPFSHILRPDPVYTSVFGTVSVSALD